VSTRSAISRVGGNGEVNVYQELTGKTHLLAVSQDLS